MNDTVAWQSMLNQVREERDAIAADFESLRLRYLVAMQGYEYRGGRIKEIEEARLVWAKSCRCYCHICMRFDKVFRGEPTHAQREVAK